MKNEFARAELSSIETGRSEEYSFQDFTNFFATESHHNYVSIRRLEGKARVYLFPKQGTKRWDTCAPEAILRAVGGLMTDLNGSPYSYDKETNVKNDAGILATAKSADHPKFLKLLPDALEQLFRNSQ